MLKQCKRLIASVMAFLMVFGTVFNQGMLFSLAADASRETIAEWSYKSNEEVPTELPATASNAVIDKAKLDLVGASVKETPKSSSEFNSTGWNTDPAYWLLELDTTGYEDLTLSASMKGSNTGPRDFKLEYSVDGTTWKAVAGSEAVLTATLAEVYKNVSLPSEISDRSTAYLRILKAGNTSINGGTVAGGGTCYLGNIIINAFEADDSSVAAPTANIDSGKTVASGTIVKLTTRTAAAKIYYESDQELVFQKAAKAAKASKASPSTASNANSIYSDYEEFPSGGIIIKEDTAFTAWAELDGECSETVSFEYFVEKPVVIQDPISDSMVKENNAITIGEAKENPDGTEVRVIGQAVYQYGSTGSLDTLIIEDVIDNEIIGMPVFDRSILSKYSSGDIIVLEASVGSFGEVKQLQTVTSSEKVGSAKAIPVQKLTIEDLLNDSESYLSTYVCIPQAVLGEYAGTGNTFVTDETGTLPIYKAAAYPDNLSEGDKADVYGAFSKYNTTYQLRNGKSTDYRKVSGSDTDKDIEVDDSVVLTLASWGGMKDLGDSLYAYADLKEANDGLDESSRISLSNGKQPMVTTSGTSTSYYMGSTGLLAGEYYLIETSSEKYGALKLSFSMRGSNTSAKNFTISYSENGTEYHTVDTVAISKASEYEDFEVALPSGASDAENLWIRITAGSVSIGGSTPAATGSNRFQGVSLIGNPIVSDTICGTVKVTPDAGEVLAGQELTMETVTEDAEIWYSINGSQMADLYDPENKPVLEAEDLPAAVTVYAAKDGMEESLPVTYGYTQAQVLPVKSNPNGGALAAGTKVTLTCRTEGASILYSTDAGVTWLPYNDETKLSFTAFPVTIKVKGTKEGYKDSEITELTFTQRLNEKYNIFFGQLHSHTEYSDGAGTCEEAYVHASQADQIDFLAVTDHSNSFDGIDTASIQGAPDSKEWAEGHELEDKYTTEDFVGIFGYEMTWSNGLGHMNTYNTEGFQSRTQSAYTVYGTALQNYYSTIKTDTGSINQFNHPGTTFGDFSDFAYYDEELDSIITLIEVGNGEGAIGSSGYFPSYEYYTRALDKGWHVAPTNNQDNHKGRWGDANTGRSVILADTLDRMSLYDGMRNMRMYATEDNDLEITYTLDDYIMGTILDEDSVGDKVTLKVELKDPTDAAIGKVQVIVNGGLVAATETLDVAEGVVTFELPSDYSYYYIKVTQPDNDIAVTAPVWIGAVEAVGITSFTTDAPLAVQGSPLNLTLEMFNNEKEDLVIDSIEFTVDENTIHTVDLKAGNMETIPSMGTGSYTFAYTHQSPGQANINVTVHATLRGIDKIYKDVLQLNYVVPGMVTRVIVDGTHFNDYVSGYYNGNMGNFAAIAAAKSVEVVIETDEITDEKLADCDLFVVTSPAKKSGTTSDGKNYSVSHFEDSFIETVKRFTDRGGSLIVCGVADYSDTVNCQTSKEMNRLLEAVGATMRINSDELMDDVEHGNVNYRLYFTNFNTDSKYPTGIMDGQTYSSYSGCSVNLDEAQEDTDTAYAAEWLVKGHPTTYSVNSKDENGGYLNQPYDVVVEEGKVVACAAQQLVGGGRVFAAGTAFISDFEVKVEQDNIWDLPYANKTIIENILEDSRAELPLSTIAEVRAADMKEVFHVRGTVTAGTSVPGNTFFDTVYIQDETGGITVFPYAESGLSLGAVLDVTGYVDAYQGDKEIQVMEAKVIDNENLHELEPLKLSAKDAMDYEKHGGQLLQVEGEVVEAETKGMTVSQIRIKDEAGDIATVFIDGYIYSKETGKNTLAEFVKVGNVISAVGLLYKHPEGDSEESVPCLRVRNCDEILLVKSVTKNLEELLADAESTLETIQNMKPEEQKTAITELVDSIIEAIKKENLTPEYVTKDMVESLEKIEQSLLTIYGKEGILVEASGNAADYEIEVTGAALSGKLNGDTLILPRVIASGGTADLAALPEGIDKDTVQCFDLSLEQSGQVIELRSPIGIKLRLTDDLTGAKNLEVYNFHGNQVLRLPYTLNGDGTISVYTTCLSTIVIGQPETSVEEPPVRREYSSDEDNDIGMTGTWILDGTGWWYRYRDGSWKSSAWDFIQGKWYYFNETGYMATGWVYVNGLWYYLQPDGSLLMNSWIYYKDKWYYAGAGGEMLVNTVIDGYRVDQDGVWIP